MSMLAYRIVQVGPLSVIKYPVGRGKDLLQFDLEWTLPFIVVLPRLVQILVESQPPNSAAASMRAFISFSNISTTSISAKQVPLP